MLTNNYGTMKTKRLLQWLLTAIVSISPALTRAQLLTYDSWEPGDHLLIPIIQYRLADFYANKKLMGLNLYNVQGALVTPNQGGDNLKFDYVPGLVAKAVIEAAQVNANSGFAKSWFYSVEDYANRCAESVPTTGRSLDDLNATKMYFALYDLTDPEKGAFRSIAKPETHANARQAMERAIEGLRDVKEHYAIPASLSKEAAGGWWHKEVYPNQMWLDGQYMGPALLAQLIHYGLTIDGAEEDWKTITRQFDITWHKLWNPKERLLRHAFSASPNDEKARLWADPKTGVSAEYWGRACGWYFLALVDVLEFIPEGITMKPTQSTLRSLPADCRARLRYYLETLAAGLKARQDPQTGCWYQLLAHDGTFTVSEYQGKTYEPVSNYLESSASSIFTATYLKAMRLGLLSEEEYGNCAECAMRGLVRQFLRIREDNGSWTLIDDCASAGLGGTSWGVRDGSAAYYLLGSDVTRITDYTEGKVYGAFILAATEYERRHRE